MDTGVAKIRLLDQALSLLQQNLHKKMQLQQNKLYLIQLQLC